MLFIQKVCMHDISSRAAQSMMLDNLHSKNINNSFGNFFIRLLLLNKFKQNEFLCNTSI